MLDNGPYLKNFPRRFRKGVESGHDDVLDCGGDVQFLQPVCKTIPGTVLLKCIESPKRLDKLLYEKWDPFRFLNNQFLKVTVHVFGSQYVVNHGAAFAIR